MTLKQKAAQMVSDGEGIFTEAQVRAMRDNVFDRPSTDNNWLACRHNWCREDSLLWLILHADPQLILR